ncbi:MAG: hypothetical protein JST01_08730 [Cyanobacteria bacterium SZAS TMP-1]|nr:hypothetical protein [Cyanobacteria bacterium SZAS TMP-1]
MATPNIAGKWRGHYQVPLFPHQDSTFTAFISEHGAQIEGAIEDDCQLGEATLTGSFSFPSVRFTKVYLNQGQINDVVKKGNKTVILTSVYGPPVEYQGTMTADGKEMSGTWTISSGNLSNHGTWTAYRLEEKDTEKANQTTRPREVKQPQEELVEVS